MKGLLYVIILFLCITSFFAGCSTDEKFSLKELRYGERDTISLGFTYRSVVNNEVNVKAPVTVNETAVNNINIYVFNELGDIISHTYSIGGGSLLGIVIYKNMRYRIYAIANIGMSVPKRTLAEVESITKVIDNISNIADSAGGVPMSGKTDLILLANDQNITVNLLRCVSKLVLKCNYAQLNSDVKVTVTSVQLKNAPAEILLFGENRVIHGAVINGEELTGVDLTPLSGAGALFYLFENMQGKVAINSLNNKQKEGNMSASAKTNSSYIEMKYDYLSASKKGTITYRFYLGKTHADCDIKRNTQYTCTVFFKGNGSAEENSWSVDNSGLVDLVTGITLNPSSHKFLTLGATLAVQATILPITANNKAITWNSSNTAVAKVDAGGIITSVGDGTCTITATSTDGTNISATCAIEVNSKICITDITVTPITLSMFTGGIEQLTAEILPANATDNSVTWSSSNTAIATVDANGNVAAIAKGSVDITVTSNDDKNKKAVCKVMVQSKELTIDPLSKTLYAGEKFTIMYTVKPPLLPSFTSDNTAVATVDANGNITAVGAGTAKITVAVHGLSVVCVITVVKPEIAFPSVGRVMYDGEIVTIPYAKLVPSTSIPTVSVNTANVEILESTNIGIKVKAKTVGNAIITATVGNVSATYNIDVQLLKIVFDGAAPLKFYQGYNDDVKYTIYPPHAGTLAITLYSDNESNLAHIIGNTFRGKAGNTTTLITAKFVDYPTKTFSVNANIRPAITIAESNIDLLANSEFSFLDNNKYPNIYVKYPLTIDKHPRAIIGWSGDKIGANKETVNVTPKGVLSTTSGTEVNGTTSLTGTLTNTDDGLIYSDNLSVRVYEAVNVWLLYDENVREALPTGDVSIEGRMSGMTDKEIGYFTGFYVFSKTDTYTIDSVDSLPTNDIITTFEESPHYPPVILELHVLEINEADRRDENGAVNNKHIYRYYYSKI
ncbi:MAG: Ig-like domain-containing protein [Bacteroidales bacterium]